jgi:hypothetical protein
MIDNSNNNNDELKYPSVSYVEELGAATAEFICASMRAANDDAPGFGACITGISDSPQLNADALAHALTQLSRTFPAPIIKGKFKQKFRVIPGRDD